MNNNPSIKFFPGCLTDDGYILVECSKGHKSAIIYDERKHDILFQSACYTFLNGYEREAVSGFASSLERLYEFFIRVIARTEAIESNTFDITWKLLSKHSERQFGCFVMFYAMATKESYSIKNKLIEFRNKVIHQGYIPKTEETWGFGESVFNIKKEIMQLLKTKFANYVEEEIKRELDFRKRQAPQELPQIQIKLTPAGVNRETKVAFDIEFFEDYLDALRIRWSS
jgi:hypothetical protein